MLTVGGLFSGFGGIELGLQRAGMHVAWHVEREWYPRRILERHWPGAELYGDVRDVRGADVAPVDVLAGGFPCQDVSDAGPRTGIDGARSGQWREFHRLVGELRPRYVVVENVAALRRRGLERVVGDLAGLGYVGEWDCLRASNFGAPHERARIFIVAYPASFGRLARTRLRHQGPEGLGWRKPGDGGRLVLPDTDSGTVLARWLRRRAGETGGPERWSAEPDVGRVAHGVPSRMERLAGLGNAVVPVVAEWIGWCVMDLERLTASAGKREGSDDGR